MDPIYPIPFCIILYYVPKAFNDYVYHSYSSTVTTGSISMSTFTFIT